LRLNRPSPASAPAAVIEYSAFSSQAHAARDAGCAAYLDPACLEVVDDILGELALNPDGVHPGQMFAVPLPLGLRTTTQVSFMTELNLSASSDLLPTTFRGRGWRSLRQTAQSCTATLAPGCPSSESQSQGSVSRVLPWMGRVRARRVERTSSLSSQFGHPSRRNSAAVATKEHSRHARSFLVDILTVECVCNSYNQARACLGRAALDSCPIWCSMCRFRPAQA